MKRLLSAILSISMLLSLLPVMAAAQWEVETDRAAISEEPEAQARNASSGETVQKKLHASIGTSSFTSYELVSIVPDYMISGSEETIMLAYPASEWKSIDSIRICNGWDSEEYIEAENRGDDTFTFVVPEYNSIRIELGDEHDSFEPYTVTVCGKSLEVTDKTGNGGDAWGNGWYLSVYNGVATLSFNGDFTGSIVSEGPLIINVNGEYSIQGNAGDPVIDVAGDLCIEGNGSLTVRGAEGQSAIRVGKHLKVSAELNAEGGGEADTVSYGTSAYFLGERDVSIRSNGEAEALVGDRAWLKIADYTEAQITEDTKTRFAITAPRFTLTFKDTDGTELGTVTELLYGESVALSDYPFEKTDGSEVLVGWQYSGDDSMIPCTWEVYISYNTVLVAHWANPGDGVVAFYEYGNDTGAGTSYYDVVPAGEALPIARYDSEWNPSTEKDEPVPRDILIWTSDSRLDSNGLVAGACYFPGATVPNGGFDGNRLLYSVDAEQYAQRYLYYPSGGSVKAGGDVLVQMYGEYAPGGTYLTAPEGKYLAGWSLDENSDNIDREIGSYPEDGQQGTVTKLYAVWEDAVPYTRASFVAELMDKKYSGYGLPNGLTIPEDCKSLDAATQKKIANAIFQGYVNTDESGNFNPDKPLTRAEAAAIVARASRGRNVVDTMTGTGDVFSDVPADYWAGGVIEFLANEQVMFGTNGTFAPSEIAKTGDVIWTNSYGSSYNYGIGGGGGGTWPVPSVPITVTLTLQGNGGVCGRESEIEIQTAPYESFSLEDYLFTREGYILDCWLDENSKEAYGAEEWIYLSEDTTLVAQWVKVGAGIQLADPSDLEWGKEYRTWWDANNEKYEYEEIPGMASWRINLPSQNEYEVFIYRVGENNASAEEVYHTRWHIGGARRTTYHSDSNFINDDMDSGTYYFTVQALGDGETYLNSEIVRSENWTYVRPNKQLPAPTGLKWDAEEDTTVRWNVVDSENVLGYEVKFYIKDSSARTGYREIGRSWGSNADDLEEKLYDSALQQGGENDFCFTVRALSRNINVIRTSVDSPMSAVRHLPRIGGDDEQGQAKQESVDSAANNLDSVLEQLKNDAIDEETKQELKEQAVESTKETLKNDLGAGTVKDALLAANNSAADSNAAKVENLIKQAEELSGVETKAQAKIDESYNEETATEQEKKEVRQLQEAAAGASMIGAALNAEGNSSVELQISKPDQNTERVIPEAYNNTLVVSFSMDLVGKSEGQEDVVLTKEANGDSKQLDIPVKLRIPVPTGINPQFLVILHHDMSGNVDEILMPYIDCDEGGKAYATFVLTHFSDFSFVEARVSFEDGGDKVNVTAKLPENASAVQAFCAAYDENGKLLAVSDTKQLKDGTVDLKLACALADVHHGKVFFVDTDGKPVASAELFEREK